MKTTNKIALGTFICTYALIGAPVVIGWDQSIQTPKELSKTPQVSIQEESQDKIACSCIKTARQQGVDIPIGTNAEDFEPNSKPEIGGLILLSYPKVDHVAKILAFKGEGFLVYEGNFKECIKGERIIAYNDQFIRGFWTP